MSANSKKSAEELLADLLLQQLEKQLQPNPELAEKQRQLLQILIDRSNDDDTATLDD